MDKELENIRIAGFKEIIGFATLVIKSLILINGGALIALLTFFGNIAGKGHKIPNNISCPFMLFSCGLGFAILCAMFAYVFQSIEIEAGKATRLKLSWPLRIISCALAVFSLVFFISGSFSSIKVFSSLNN